LRSTTERASDRLLTLGWLSICLAVVASGVAAVRDGWLPAGDSAVIASLVMDSVSLDPPLVGAPTSLGAVGGQSLHHLGPLGLWVLALPTWLFGAPGHGLVIATASVSVVSIAGVGALARRLRDRRLEAVLLVAVAAMVATIGGARFCDPLNPHIAILPLLLFLVSSWGVLAGHPRQVWIVVVAGSLTAQSHLGYVPMVAAVLSVVVVALLIEARARSGASRRWLTHQVLPVAGLLGIAAWVGPIIDEIVGSQNLTRLARYQLNRTNPTVGLEHGIRLLVEMTSIPPMWLLGRATDTAVDDPGPLRIALSLASIAGVALILWLARRRGDRTITCLAALSLLSLAVATASSAGIERGLLAKSLLFYRLFWWPVGVLFTTTLIGGLAAAVAAARAQVPAHDPPRARFSWWPAPVVGVAIVIAALGYQPPDADLIDAFEANIDHAQAVADLPNAPRTVVLTFDPPAGNPAPESDPSYFFGQVFLAQLRLQGIEVRLSDAESAEVNSPLAAYRESHPVRGDEDLAILFRAGAGVLAEDPAGFERISAAAPNPEDSGNPFLVPSVVYVADATGNWSAVPEGSGPAPRPVHRLPS